jgi:SpoVK/Ycf46/Vps4 family AAA+-type ATPase
MRAMRCFNRAEALVQSSKAGARIIFSSKQTEMFRQIAQTTRESGVSSGRRKLASDSSGVVAVFSGSSGTGKTLAAEVIARELRTSLVRVNLNHVVSKYIGETEKNLARIFETAQKKAAVLLFDEADALFGKRSEVKDSHDRYANIEVSEVLSKVEAYRGLVILSSNHRVEIDPTVMCRVKYLLEFSSPIPVPRRQLRP